MSEGTGRQYDHPFKLLANNDEDTEITKHDSEFAQMVQASEKAQENLFKQAKENYLRKK